MSIPLCHNWLMNMTSFGIWLKQAIVGAGLNQPALARRVGVDASQVSRWTRDLDRPRREHCLMIARAPGGWCSTRPGRSGGWSVRREWLG